MDEPHGGRQTEAPALYERRRAAAEEALKGFGNGRDVAAASERLPDVRPAYGLAAGRRRQLLATQRVAEPRELGQDLRVPLVSLAAKAPELIVQFLCGGATEEVAEHVERERGELEGDLHAGDHLDAVAPRRRERLREAVDRVVIRDGHGTQAELGGVGHELCWRQRAVGGGSVGVEVDHDAATIAWCTIRAAWVPCLCLTTAALEPPMKIGMIAPPWFPLPPRGYGGIEFVVSHLTEGLVGRGHEVTLFASGDSATEARLHYVFETAPSHRIETGMLEIVHSIEAYRRAGEFDLIHDHSGFASRALGALVHHVAGTPVIVTLHGPADQLSREIFSALREDLAFIAISEYQRQGFPDLRFIATIPNAVDVAAHPFSAEKDDYLLFMGRMNPEKGAHVAIEVAQLLGRTLIMAGKMNELAELDYFHERVDPYLCDTIQFRGEVDHTAKLDLYRRARATLFPIQWPEPFGLVMIESMAAGTPVIAFRRGSVPEVVEHGRSGFIVDTVGEMVEAVERLGEIDPYECRRVVEERFGLHTFVVAHETAYRELITSR